MTSSITYAYMELRSEESRIDFVISSSILSFEQTMNNAPIIVLIMTMSLTIVSAIPAKEGRTSIDVVILKKKSPHTISDGINRTHPIGLKKCGKRNFFINIDILS